MDNNYYIYRHIRLDTGQPFYVGKGKGGRLNGNNSRNAIWRNIVSKVGYKAEIVINNLTENEAFKKEVYFIELYRRYGLCKANLTNGGEGTSGYRWSEDRKMAYYNSNMRVKKSINSSKMWASEGHKLKMSNSIKKSHSRLEVIKKLSDVSKRLWSTEEYRTKVISKCGKKGTKVINMVTGVLYNSIQEVADYENVDSRTIRRWIELNLGKYKKII